MRRPLSGGVLSSDSFWTLSILLKNHKNGSRHVQSTIKSVPFQNNKINHIPQIKSNNQNVNLTVEDQGPGFKENNINQIFNRFYSNRPEKFGEHTGLGLNIVKNIIELHGGTINASNNAKAAGAKIDINFPEYSN